MVKHLLAAGTLAAGVLATVVPAAAQVSDGIVKIGILNDMSGPYVDLAGPGSVLAAQMAAEEFGGRVAGMPIEIVSGDHQNKPDIGSTIVRRWYDTEKVDAIADVPTSSVALAVQAISRDKKRIFLISGAATATLSGKDCSPYSIQTSDDTTALSVGTTRAVVKAGLDTWFFLTADYVFGHAIEAESTKIVQANGGKVVGSVRHPQNTQDFASYLLQAQRSGAKAIGLANAGNDTVTAIKQAVEFGIPQRGQRLVGQILFISDIHSLGLPSAFGLQLTEGFYWDMNEASREWSQRFFKRFGKMPTRQQATTYATVAHYLRAIDSVKTDDPDRVMAEMKRVPMKYFGSEGRIREDGRFVHDLALYEVKKPEESKYPWDYYKKVATIPGDEAFTPLKDSQCPLVRK